MTTVQSLNLTHYPSGMVSSVPVPADAVLLGVVEVAGQPMLSYTSSLGGAFQPREVLIVGEYSPLPDLPLRRLGSYVMPGAFTPTHVFELQ